MIKLSKLLPFCLFLVIYSAELLCAEWNDVWIPADAKGATHIRSVSLDRSGLDSMIADKKVTHLDLVNCEGLAAADWPLVGKLTQLEHLEIGRDFDEPGGFYGPGRPVFEWEELAFLKQLTGLRTLVLSNIYERTDDEDWSWLAGMKELKRLELPGSGVLEEFRADLTEKGVNEVLKLKGLEELVIGSVHIDDATLKRFIELKSLKRLVIKHHSLTAAALQTLASMKQLESLEVDLIVGMKPEQLASLAHLRHLFIYMPDDWGDKSLDALSHFKQLRSLSIRCLSHTQAIHAALKAAAGLKELEALRIHSDYQTAILVEVDVSFAALKKLKKLELIAVPLHDKQLSTILELEQLEELTIQRPFHLTSKAMAGISKLKNLKCLYLERWLLGQGGPKIVPTDTWVDAEVLRQIAKLEHLERLELAGFESVVFENNNRKPVEKERGVSDATIEILAAMASLRHLSLRNTSITAASTKAIVGMKQLKHFNANNMEFEDAELAGVARQRPDLRISNWQPAD